MCNFAGKKGLYLLLPLLAVAVAFVLAFTLGFARDRYIDGATVYVASVSTDVTIEDVDTAALYEAVKTALGRNAVVNLGYNYVSSGNELTVEVSRGEAINEQAVVDMLASDYADLGVESFSAETYNGTDGSAFLFATLIILALTALVCWAVCAFVCGMGNALRLLAGALCAAGFVTLVYVLARIGNFRLYIAALAAAILFAFAFGCAQVLALNKQLSGMKKPDRLAAADAAGANGAQTAVGILIVSFLFAAAFAAAGLISGVVPYACVGAMIFAVALGVEYIVRRFVPALWISAK